MKKQTAVEWLIEQIIKEKGLVDLDIQSAKDMEKEQIKDAYKEGAGDIDVQYKDVGEINSEGYYNENYGDDT
jgi:hypothetical protein